MENCGQACYEGGYVREMFERNTGRTARVELTDSVLRGGKSCAFTVKLLKI